MFQINAQRPKVAKGQSQITKTTAELFKQNSIICSNLSHVVPNAVGTYVLNETGSSR